MYRGAGQQSLNSPESKSNGICKNKLNSTGFIKVDINTLEAALGFGSGVALSCTTVWGFIVSPLRAELKAEREANRDFMNRILRKAGYDV